MRKTDFLSRAIGEVRGELATLAAVGDLATAKVDDLVERLQLLSRFARSMEHELAVFRLMEAGKSKREAMEELAQRVLTASAIEAGDKVVRPDFRRTT